MRQTRVLNKPLTVISDKISTWIHPTLHLVLGLRLELGLGSGLKLGLGLGLKLYLGLG